MLKVAKCQIALLHCRTRTA